jgi:hypothetical protein
MKVIIIAFQIQQETDMIQFPSCSTHPALFDELALGQSPKVRT